MPRCSAIVPLFFATGLAGSLRSANPPARYSNLLLGRIWQQTGGVARAAPGSLYIFLANGNLLEGSCVETYRIATWTADSNSVLHVTEDRRPAFTATILELTDKDLRLRQELVRTHEQRTMTLKAVEGEFVCPDLVK